MLISFNWLNNYLNLKKTSPEKLSGYFNELGFTVEGFSVIRRYLANIVVSKIINIEKHPNADRLQIATVTDGKKQYQIVCGAPNIKVGDIVPLALPGAEIQKRKLQPANIRGVNSAGMLCSARELEIGSDQRGIWQLPKEWQPGKPLKFYIPETDYLYELEIPTNRPDCLGYLGISRELAVKLDETLKLPKIPALPAAKEKFPVRVHSGNDCSYYLAIVFRDITIAESPAWMQLYLLSCGLRPINNIVDITNYVLLEYGHPLHAFDREKLTGDRIIVRRASKEEKLVLLDEQEIKLTPDDLVIADSEKPVALAGIMGGKFSGITEKTNEIILESAVFSAPLIRQTRKKFNLNTNASYRFERSTNFFNAYQAARRTANLIKEIAGGKIIAISEYQSKRKTLPPEIKISPRFINDFGSIKIKKNAVTKILKQLNYQVKFRNNNFYLKPPIYRQDIQQVADVMEEICRHYGYQHIEEKPLPISAGTEKNLLWELSGHLRKKLLTTGLSEITTNPLISASEWETGAQKTPQAKIIRLANPTSTTNNCLRPNLITGLLRVSEENTYESNSRKYFEIGNVFIDEKTEENHLGIILAGKTTEPNWLTNEDFTFFHLKGILENIFSFAPALQFIPEENKINILADSEKVGVALQIKDNYYSEICLEKLLPYYSNQKSVYQPFSQFPRISLDLALVCPKNKSYREIKDLLFTFLKDKFLEEIYLFDVYSGKNIPEDKKSFTFRLNFRSPTETLTSETINHTIQKLLEYLRLHNVELRGEKTQ